MRELLDDPIWNALTTEQRHLAVLAPDGSAARFPPDVTALAALRATEPLAVASLASLLPAGTTTGIFLPLGVEISGPLRALDGAELLQMVRSSTPVDANDDQLVELGAADAAEMLALAERTRPGPFGLRTGELGTFLGLREDGRLIAMAGQRLCLPGLVEVSGICTDPSQAGRGLAARLTLAQCARIEAAGRTAFLHVRASNARAIALYERLGFAERRRFRYHVVAAA